MVTSLCFLHNGRHSHCSTCLNSLHYHNKMRFYQWKPWDLQTLNNVPIVIYFVWGACKSSLLWMYWPKIWASFRLHIIFPDCSTLSLCCPRWPILMPFSHSQLKSVAGQWLVFFISEILLESTRHSLALWASFSQAPWNCPWQLLSSRSKHPSPQRCSWNILSYHPLLPQAEEHILVLSMPPATRTQNALCLFVLCSHCHLVWPPGPGAQKLLQGHLLSKSSVWSITKALYSEQSILDLSASLHGNPTPTPQYHALSALKSKPQVGSRHVPWYALNCL